MLIQLSITAIIVIFIVWCLKRVFFGQDKLLDKSALEIKKDELNASLKEWKHRVEKSDAEKFSVAGRMDKNSDWSNLVINIPTVDKEKRTPQAKRFKGKEGTDSSSTPGSPEKNKRLELNRSYSVPYPDLDSSGSDTSPRSSSRRVAVSRPDDFTFKSFYSSVETTTTKTDQIDLSVDDLDSVPRQSLLVQRKNVQVQRRRVASKNPIKALATRTDIINEYTEVITGVAERERKRLNIEKLAKGSNMAPAALAGLVSKEDFTSVALKKSSTATTLLPYKSVMLLHVKGRQHVQTRLVEPSSKSINEGDTFILVTPAVLFNYIGNYSNVIEQSRAADIINHIQKSGDLGCKEAGVVTVNAINSKIMTQDIRKFWKILGFDEAEELTGGGHPDEDSTYETNILSTNMIYKIEGNELVPFEEYWGSIPKIEMLQPTKVIVFDFGSEMYVWSGKNASITEKKLAFKLAKELWESGYDYSDCSICPVTVAGVLGNRLVENSLKKAKSRPDWALFAKVTQHRETVLFKEKFLDWPDFSRVIQVKGDQNEKKVEVSYNLTPYNVDALRHDYNCNPDLVIEGQHLGRGDKYFNEETKRLFKFDTLKISVWRINDNQPQKLDTGLVGQFFNNDSYIVKWEYRITVQGRELSGKPSRHFQAGRDKCVYFYWQGSRASINEKGLAALLTVELDVEKAPQLRIADGTEPAAFMRLFKGSMIVSDRRYLKNSVRLYMVRGEIDEEVSLIEVLCQTAALRSRTHFLLVNYKESQITIWNGSKSTKQKKRAAEGFSQILMKDHRFDGEVEIQEIEEDDDEEEDFYDSIDGSRDNYCCLVNSKLDYDYTMRLFYLSSVSGSFKATEVVCLYKSEFSSPFPFLQAELYSASQPALFLIDNHHELWLWQGWWPEREEDLDLSDQTGSGAVRWQAERKAAMQTAVNYWQKSQSGDESIPAYLVWAGLEPLEFKNLFPHWVDRNDVMELNMKAGKKESKILVEKELALLLRRTYSLSELMQRPLPDGVDPTQLEIYLSPDDFQELLSMSKEEFQKLPMWKQTAVKKEKGLF